MFVMFCLLLNGLLGIGQAVPTIEHNTRTFKNALNQQGLQTILQSIEERLRNLDQVYSIRYTPRGDLNTDQYIRKIELLEAKLTRMEAQIEAHMQKISENMSSKNFKDDMVKDQLFRKIDSVYERINHKLSYVEGKMDMDVLKLQTKIETAISKTERLDHSFSVRQADMESEISEAVEMMENVKNNVADIENKLLNVTQKSIESTFIKQILLAENKFENVTNKIEQIDKRINNSLEQCNQKDFLNDFTNKDMHLSKTFKEYEDQIQSYGNKVNNMYNELWKKSTTIENTIKNSVLLMNLTRKEIQDMKKPGNTFTTYNNQNDGQLEMAVDSFTNTIHRKFAELGHKLESNFENVMLVQNLFLESCHRIQMDESQLENKISLVLEKLLDAVTNRSVNTFKEIQSMEELIKLHDSNVYRTMNQNTNTIIKLSEKTSEDRKKLEKILSTMKKDIGNAIESMRNEISVEDQENSQKFDTIAGILLELQEQVNDLDNRVNEDNINYNTKQTLQDILLVTKALPNKETFAEQLNITVLDNMDSLSKLMTHIYHVLVAINTKINKSYLDYHPVELAENINNNHTKVTNIQREKKHEDNEPLDIVLEILPEKNKGTGMKQTILSRYNYTLITTDTTDTITQKPKNISESSYFTDKIIKNRHIHSSDMTKNNITSKMPYFFDKNNNDTIINSNVTNEKIQQKTIASYIFNANQTIEDLIESISKTIKLNKNRNETFKHLQNKKNKIQFEQHTIQNYTIPENKNEKIEDSLNRTVHFVTDTAEYDINKNYTEYNHTNSKKDLYIKENSTSKGENNNGYTTPSIYEKIEDQVTKQNKNNSNHKSSTVADIIVSDSTQKTESETTQTNEIFNDIIDDTENSTLYTQNSFEYTDLINNSTYDHTRDEYEWNYED